MLPTLCMNTLLCTCNQIYQIGLCLPLSNRGSSLLSGHTKLHAPHTGLTKQSVLTAAMHYGNKFGMVRALHEALPVGAVLGHRIPGVSSLNKCCNEVAHTVPHALFHCQQTSCIWFISSGNAYSPVHWHAITWYPSPNKWGKELYLHFQCIEIQTNNLMHHLLSGFTNFIRYFFHFFLSSLCL